MNKALLFGVLPAAAAMIYTFHQPGDFFKSVGCGFCVLAVGLYLTYCDDAWPLLIVDNPLGSVWPLDVVSAMDRVKTALVISDFQGYRWRLLQFDPDLGAISACLDVLDLEIGSDRTVQTVRRQVMLIAEFDSQDAKTRVQLRWRARCGSRRDFATQAILNTTERINVKLAG